MALSLVACADSKPSEAVRTAQLVEDAFAEVVEAARPAVVVITNKQSYPDYGNFQMRNMPYDLFDFFNLPFSRDYFRNQDRQREDSQRNRTPQIAARGSGFIVKPDGYIVTNFHVIKDSEYLEVKTSDGTIYDNFADPNAVKVVGYDEESDLAVLQIGDGKKKDFPCLSFADSDKMRVGQWAIAIGAPFNLENSVTIGCISQKGRTDMGMSTFDSYIQTDASINPGNSGGPLLNIKSEVIGVNQFIYTGGDNKGSVGIGFAIASNLVRQITDTLIKNGEVIRPFLGISMQERSKAYNERFSLDHGVLVREVLPGEAAEKAGIKVNDIILEIGGHKVMTSHELLMEVTKFKPGDKIPLLILRGEKEMKISVKAGRRDEYNSTNSGRKPGKSGKSFNGVNVMNKMGLRLAERDGNVVVTEVIGNGAADKAGASNDDKILPGDIIVEVNCTAVSTIADIRKAMAATKKNTVILYMERGNNARGAVYKYLFAMPLGDDK